MTNYSYDDERNSIEQPQQPAYRPVEQPPARPWMTFGIIAVCIAFYLLSLQQSQQMGSFLSPDGNALVKLGALIGDRVRAGEWWRLLTVGLLHGSVIHLGMNMLALYYLGPPIESWQGSWRLLVAFIGSVFIGSLASISWNSNVFAVGASGGIFGLLGFLCAILLRYYKEFPPQTRESLMKYLRSILLINIAISFMPQIDFAAHIGGLIGGFVIGLMISTSPFKRYVH